MISYCDKHHKRITEWPSIQAWGNLRAAEWANLSSLPYLQLFISSLVSECNDSKNSTKITNSSGIFRSVISRSFWKNLITLFGPSKWHSCSLFQFFFSFLGLNWGFYRSSLHFSTYSLKKLLFKKYCSSKTRTHHCNCFVFQHLCLSM